MKNLIFLFTFSAIFFAACNTDSNSNNSKQALSDEELWSIFETDFKKLVGKNDIQGVVKLVDFPLEGNFFQTNTGKGLSRAGFITNYDKIIGNDVRLRVMAAKKEEWSERKINSADEAKKYGIPVGEMMKVLTLNFVFDEGEDNQTESAQMFYFGKIKGNYKWSAMEIAG